MQPPCTRRYFSFQAAYSTRILLRRFVAHSYGRRATFVDQSSMRTNISKPVHASPPSSFVSYISSSRSSKTISPEFSLYLFSIYLEDGGRPFFTIVDTLPRNFRFTPFTLPTRLDGCFPVESIAAPFPSVFPRVHGSTDKIDVETRVYGFASPPPLAANSKYSGRKLRGGGDSRAAWRPERRTKECRLERRGLTRINANWAAATGSSSSSSSIFVAANGSVAVLAFLHPPASILRCFRCALVP